MPPSDRDSSVENVPVLAPGIPGVLRRSLAKLLSSAHLVLSGTTASILVIIFLGSLFVFVALRNHHRDEIRARTVQLTRLSSLIENDIAELENYYRGFLLTHRSQYFAPFQERRNAMKKRLEELNGRLLDNPVQRKRVIKAQDIVLRWADQVAQPAFLGQSAPSTGFRHIFCADIEQRFARSSALDFAVVERRRTNPFKSACGRTGDGNAIDSNP